MSSCLIGHTGFVGRNLNTQVSFTHHFNSRNIADIADSQFSLVVCAGVSAVKWKANKEPEADWAAIERLLAPLGTVRADRFVLISTVDVFARPIEVDEQTPVDEAAAHPYGLHRLRVEQFVSERFPQLQIVRLPGLFGPGLRKNAIYDLMNDHLVDNIDPDAHYQFYDTRRLWADITKSDDIPLLHVATEPLRMGDIAQTCFGRALAPKDQAHGRYDFRTAHGARWGRSDGYLYDAGQVMSDLQDWLARERT